MSKSQWTKETPFSQSNDQQIVYTGLGRLMAVIVGCGLIFLAAVDELLLGGTRIGSLIADVLGAGIFVCLLTAVVGRASND